MWAYAAQRSAASGGLTLISSTSHRALQLTPIFYISSGCSARRCSLRPLPYWQIADLSSDLSTCRPARAGQHHPLSAAPSLNADNGIRWVIAVRQSLFHLASAIRIGARFPCKSETRRGCCARRKGRGEKLRPCEIMKTSMWCFGV